MPLCCTELCHQPIRFVDSQELRNFCVFLRPELKLTDIPHRTKMRELIIEALGIEFRHLREDILVSQTRSQTHL